LLAGRRGRTGFTGLTGFGEDKPRSAGHRWITGSHPLIL
jgi:hypothetical protein